MLLNNLKYLTCKSPSELLFKVELRLTVIFLVRVGGARLQGCALTMSRTPAAISSLQQAILALQRVEHLEAIVYGVGCAGNM
eukprot:5762297-Amphidinium_carterae.1